MRHGKRFNHLGRKPAHRKATLSNMASSLILHKRINTTVAKAKALKKFVEPIITRSKDDTTHSRRMVFRYLQNKDSVKELFGDIAEKVADRPGGYTRLIRVGNRLGDNADMCVLELVDYNELMLEGTQEKSKTRRGRRKKSSGGAEPAVETAVAEAEVVEEAVVEEVPTDTVEEVQTEEAAPEVEAEEIVTETPEAVETVEEVVEETPVEAVVEETPVEDVVEVEQPVDEATPEVEAKADEAAEESKEEGTDSDEESDKDKS